MNVELRMAFSYKASGLNFFSTLKIHIYVTLTGYMLMVFNFLDKIVEINNQGLNCEIII